MIVGDTYVGVIFVLSLGDQDMNHTILEMGCAFKIESRRFRMKNRQKENRVTGDAIFVSMIMDLQKRQSDECEEMLEKILDMVREIRLWFRINIWMKHVWI